MDWTYYVFRVVLVLQGAFVVGVAVIAIALYWRNHLIHHISLMALSYSILIGTVIHSLYNEVYALTSYKGLFVAVAFVLGDYALLRMVVRHQNGTSGEIAPNVWREWMREIVDASLERRFGPAKAQAGKDDDTQT